MTLHTPIEQEAEQRKNEAQRAFEREQVAAHYEHDVEIFKRVLDSQLTYSTGIFCHADDDLETAQTRKFDRLGELLNLTSGEVVLDVGCGWGSVLLALAERSEARFIGVTLSSAQRTEAIRRARQRGYDQRIEILHTHLEDLRLPPASFDAVIFSGSIVHMHHREVIHRQVAHLLRPGGRLLISDCYFPRRTSGPRDSRATQFILGDTLGYCRLIHLSEELAMIESAGLDIRSVEDLTDSYARTVAFWIDNIRRHRAEIDARAPGFAHRLQAYMTVGKASFALRRALEYLVLAQRPG